MTFEEYIKTYSDVCHGCAMISIFYEEEGYGKNIPNEVRCLYLAKNDLSEHCPCTTCLVKMKCVEGCLLFDTTYDRVIRGIDSR